MKPEDFRKRFTARIAFEKGYRVSECGTRVTSPRGNTIKPWPRKGYLRFSISIDGHSKPVQVHRLQAYQQWGEEIYKSGIQVRHLDGNSLNNAVANLALGTMSDNMMDRPAELRRKIAGDANRKHDPQAIREFYEICGSYGKTMDRFKISSKGTLHYILNEACGITQPTHLQREIERGAK